MPSRHTFRFAVLLLLVLLRASAITTTMDEDNAAQT